MKFELGEIVYSLHFDECKTIYLEQSLVIGVEANVRNDIHGEIVSDLKECISTNKIRLYKISYSTAFDRYILDEEDIPYTHPEEKIFKTKQEALIYLHGLIADIAK